MRWSWKFTRLAGVDVYIHATFFILIGWVFFSHLAAGQSFAGAAAGLVFTLALFSCVLLHEFGHALAARRYGIATHDITLLPIGGVARLERMPEDPRQELYVALAGPAVNVAISVMLYLWLVMTSSLVPFAGLGVATGPFAERLLALNVFLVLFNMIPAFPMDGGRVLRAFLAMRMDYVRATQIAAGIGQGLAMVFGFIGLFSNPFLVFIALFVWIGAAQEGGFVEMQRALSGIPVYRAMITDFRTLHPGDDLAKAAQLILDGFQTDFPVVENGRVVGILTRSDLINALTQKGEHSLVETVMQRSFETADSGEMLERVFSRLQTGAFNSVPIIDRSRLVGLVTAENIAELLMIKEALRTRMAA